MRTVAVLVLISIVLCLAVTALASPIQIAWNPSTKVVTIYGKEGVWYGIEVRDYYNKNKIIVLLQRKGPVIKVDLSWVKEGKYVVYVAGGGECASKVITIGSTVHKHKPKHKPVPESKPESTEVLEPIKPAIAKI